MKIQKFLAVGLVLCVLAVGLTAPVAAQDNVIWFGASSTSLDPYYIPLFTLGRAILAEQDVRIEFVALPTDEALEAALDQGRVDVGFLSTGGIHLLNDQGSNTQFVAGILTQNPFVLVTAAEVESLEELRGGVTAAHGQGSLSVAVADAMYAADGLQAGVDYEIVFMPGSNARADALEAGLLDSAVIFGPVATSLVDRSEGRFKVYGGTWDVLPPMLWEGIAMSDEFLNSNPELAASFVDAVLETYDQFYALDPAEMVAMVEGIPETVDLDLNVLESEYRLYQEIKIYPVDGGLSEDSFMAMTNWLVEQGQLDAAQVVSYETAVTPRFVEAALSDDN